MFVDYMVALCNSEIRLGLCYFCNSETSEKGKVGRYDHNSLCRQGWKVPEQTDH